LHAELGEMRDERCAKETRWRAACDDNVLRLRLELRPDGVIGGIDRRLARLVAVTNPGRLSARVSPVE